MIQIKFKFYKAYLSLHIQYSEWIIITLILEESKKTENKQTKTTTTKADKKKAGKAAKDDKPKDQKRPKRSWPAFFFFQQETRLKLKTEFPNLSQKELVAVSGFGVI